jgi:hypothetical protein
MVTPKGTMVMPAVSLIPYYLTVARISVASDGENRSGSQETGVEKGVVRESAASSKTHLGRSSAYASGSGHALEVPKHLSSNHVRDSCP